jgi:hypothetical protein
MGYPPATLILLALAGLLRHRLDARFIERRDWNRERGARASAMRLRQHTIRQRRRPRSQNTPRRARAAGHD